RPLFFIVAREQAFVEGVSFPDEIGRVRVVAYVLGMDLVVGEKIVHHAGQEGDIASGPNGCVVIRNSSRPREPWVDHHQLGTAMVLRLSYPFESAGVGLRSISTHNPGDISILDVSPAVGHRTATERWAQTGHRRSVSDPSLVFELEHSQAASDLVGQPAAFIREGASRQEGRRRPAIDDYAILVPLDEVRVTT